MNDSLRSRGSSSTGPVVEPAFFDVTMFRTPGGSPASVRICASASIDSGVSAAGLTIIVQPAATAGPILRVPIAVGKFQGVMNRQGPTAWRRMSSRPLPPGSTV